VPGSPWLPRSYLERPALWTMLDGGTDLGVTMLVAPAGAGKTLGVAGWLQQRTPEPTEWVDGHQQSGPRLDRLLEEAGDREGPPALVVVDDAHLLPATAVRALDARLAATPDRLRVVLLTRWDLALSKLVPQLLGHLTVIRGDALRLTDAESGELVRVHVPEADDALVDAIRSKAQGWCAAVVLASRAGAASPSSADVVRRLRAPGPGVADLVAGEVFAGMHPRERHLLLCCAAEPVLTAALADRLTGDPGAGDVLATLEQTGLLVNRVAADRDDEDADPSGVLYTIHPLLREVARRRLVAGGVDAERARESVLRETRLDLAQGDIAVAFPRLMTLGEYDAAVEVAATHGLWMTSQGHGAGLDALVRVAGATVEDRPDVWPAIAWNAWVRGAAERAEHWAQRVEALAPPGVDPVRAAAVALRRTRYAREQPGTALADGRGCLDTADRQSQDPWFAALLLEMGVAENWLGLLAEAEEHLGEAIVIGRASGLDGLVAEAFSHLALTQFMLGRNAACLDAAGHVLVADEGAVATADAVARAAVARELVELGALPFGEVSTVPGAVTAALDDPTARVWQRVAGAGRALQAGSLAEAERALDVRGPGTRLPAHLLAVLLVERAAVGVAAGDRHSLRTVAADLERLDAAGELAWVKGALSDLDGDVRNAALLYDDASRYAAERHDTRLGSVALVCSAQVRASQGDRDGARRRLGEALALTQPDRFAWSFLGWSTHGTRVGELMSLLDPALETAWIDEVRRACADRPSIVARFRSLVATERELETVTAPVNSPTLSPREREVLIELARGSTYADIAANLFVSENTVKTHISSLYSKLSAGRRSEALAVARTMHLI
jgi:LuxR family maltose regulon positive regulatory protein